MIAGNPAHNLFGRVERTAQHPEIIQVGASGIAHSRAHQGLNVMQGLNSSARAQGSAVEGGGGTGEIEDS